MLFTVFNCSVPCLDWQAVLKQQKAELEAERKRLDDPRYIEKLAREDYNMVGKDEVPLFIVDEQKDKQ